MNFGVCKGLTFDRVIITPNGPFMDYINKGKKLASPEKYYVAVTRAKYSVSFIFPTIPLNYKECIELEYEGVSFSIYRLV